MFIHLLDGAQLLERLTNPKIEIEDAIEVFLKCYTGIRTELGLYNEALLHKPEIVVLNKIDLLPKEIVEKTQKLLRDRLHRFGTRSFADEPFAISGVSGEGIQNLLNALRLELFDPSHSDLQPKKAKPVQLPDGQPFQLPKDWSPYTAYFGGTFDPPHRGHLEAALGLLNIPGVKEVAFLPSGTPPWNHNPPLRFTVSKCLKCCYNPLLRPRSFALKLSRWIAPKQSETQIIRSIHCSRLSKNPYACLCHRNGPALGFSPMASLYRTLGPLPLDRA